MATSRPAHQVRLAVTGSDEPLISDGHSIAARSPASGRSQERHADTSALTLPRHGRLRDLLWDASSSNVGGEGYIDRLLRTLVSQPNWSTWFPAGDWAPTVDWPKALAIDEVHRLERGGFHSACKAFSRASASLAVSHSIQVTSHSRIHRFTGSMSDEVITVGRMVVLLVGAMPRCSQTFRRNDERVRFAPLLRWSFQIRP